MRQPPASADLEHVRRRWDLEAAVLGAGGAPVRDAVLRFCRGWVSLPDAHRDRELDRARRGEEERRRATADDSDVDPSVQAAVAGMVAGRGSRLALVRLDVDGITTCALSVSADGVVAAERTSGPHDVWAELLPSTDPGLRGYLLAGGVRADGSESWRSRGTVAEQAEQWMYDLGIRRAGKDVPYVLLRPAGRWRTIDVFAEAMRNHVLPAADFTLGWSWPELGQLAAEWSAAAPLRRGYEIAVAAVDPRDGAVGVHTAPLFAAGIERHRHTELRTTVDLARPDGRAGPALLTILESSPLPIGERRVVALTEVELPAEAAVVDMILRRAGTVDVESVRASPPTSGVRPARAMTQPADPNAWVRLTTGRQPHAAAHVVVAVELAGPAAAVLPRLETACNLLRALHARDLHSPGYVDVTVIGYADHDDSAREADGAVLTITATAAPELVLRDYLTRWFPQPPRGRYGTSLEDALRCAAQLQWRENALRSLLVIGSRPPAVQSQGRKRGGSCPWRIDWTVELETLHDVCRARSYAVVDLPHWIEKPPHDAPVERTLMTWDRIGRDGRFPANGVGIDALVDDLAPLPAPMPLAVLLDHGG